MEVYHSSCISNQTFRLGICPTGNCPAKFSETGSRFISYLFWSYSVRPYLFSAIVYGCKQGPYQCNQSYIVDSWNYESCNSSRRWGWYSNSLSSPGYPHCRRAYLCGTEPDKGHECFRVVQLDGHDRVRRVRVQRRLSLQGLCRGLRFGIRSSWIAGCFHFYGGDGQPRINLLSYEDRRNVC